MLSERVDVRGFEDSRIDRVETARFGKLATAVCAANGWETGSANHPVFGRINSYPHEALALVFGD